MIDVARLRDDSEYRAGIERKRVRPGLVDEVLAAAEARRAVRTEVEELRARQNAASKKIAKAPSDERRAMIDAAGALKEELATKEPELAAAEATLRDLSLELPNPAAPSVPDGGEDDASVVRTVGEPTPAPTLDHAALGHSLGFVENEQAATLSGTRFAYLASEAVLVELALVQWVMSRLVTEGFTPIVPPVLVREHAMQEAGFFPTDRAQVYEVDGGELYLVGTSEVSLAALHRGEILDREALPMRYGGFSTCFRREAGTHGKDTRGIFRVHQFDKVEMFSFSHPSESWEEMERLLAIEESIVANLGLPYRIVDIAAGDLGAAAARKYDIEVWLPSEGRYRELTSCSNYLEYSARRLDTRVRADGKTELVHTLNGTACAIGRTLVFLMEHCQSDAGGFVVPEVLRPFCGVDEVLPR